MDQECKAPFAGSFILKGMEGIGALPLFRKRSAPEAGLLPDLEERKARLYRSGVEDIASIDQKGRTYRACEHLPSRHAEGLPLGDMEDSIYV